MRTRRYTTAVAIAAASLLIASCNGDGDGGSDDGAGDGGAAGPESLQIVAAAAPGGGWDQTARAAQQAFEQNDIVGNVEVTNMPGAAGTIGLARVVNESGNAEMLLVVGSVMVGGIETNDSAATLADVTPIARLTSDNVAIVVNSDSPHQTLDDFVEAWKEDPGALAIGGGSAGGIDHILMGLLAQDAGIDPQEINYIPFAGGGEATAAILGGQVAAGVSGLSEFQGQVDGGTMRWLGISGPDPVEGVDAPTLTEAGYDVELVNWRGLVGPPGLSDEETQALRDAVAEMVATDEWQETLETNSWIEDYADADEFGPFVESEQERIREVLEGLGLV